MENVYSAQNIAAYLILQLKQQNLHMTKCQLQMLLQQVDENWMLVYGHSAFREQTSPGNNYYVKEVFDVYETQCETDVIVHVAKDWFLPYGQFQLMLVPYKAPLLNSLEKRILKNCIIAFLASPMLKVS